MTIRKHKGINQKTGKLKKGFKYSGKKLKSGLSQIIKIQKGGENKKLFFKPKHGIEKKYNYCKSHSDCENRGIPMKFCCPPNTKAKGYCRNNLKSCNKTGINAKPRKRDVTPLELAILKQKKEKSDQEYKRKQNVKDMEALTWKTSPKKNKTKIISNTGFLPPLPESPSKKPAPKKSRSIRLYPRTNKINSLVSNLSSSLSKSSKKNPKRMTLQQRRNFIKNIKNGGAVLGQGGFGCVVSPNLVCKKHQKSSNKNISKIIKNPEAFQEEVRNVKIMQSIDPNMKYSLYPTDYCKLDEQLNKNSILGCFKCGKSKDLEICKSKMGIDGESPYVLYNVVQPFGGNDLYKLNSIQRQLLSKNFDFYKEYLTKGIKSMHSKNIIHRDIKPENIVLNNNGDIRFIDIGFVHKLEPRDFSNEDYLITLLGSRTIFFRPLDLDMIEFWLYYPKYRTLYWSGFFKEWQKRRPAKYSEDVKSISDFNGWDYKNVIQGLKTLFNKLSVKFIKKYVKDNIYKWDTYSLHLSFNEMARALTPKSNSKKFGFDSGVTI